MATMTDKLQTCVEITKLVAEAIGINFEVMGYDVVRYTDAGSALFNPLESIDYAFWAAEQVGLFKNHFIHRPYDDWAVERYEDSETITILTEAETPTLAICLAILKLKESQ